jgi:hypothetical protein
LGELFRVTSPSLIREVEEKRSNPGAEVLCDFLDAAPVGRLGAGTNESAPPETWLGKRQTLYIEHPWKTLLRSLVVLRGSGDDRPTPAA